MTQSMYDLVEAVYSAYESVLGADIRGTGNEDMTENIPQTPLVEVYGDEGSGAANSATSTNTFSGKIKLRKWALFADWYAWPRANLGTAYAKLHQDLDKIMTVLDAQAEAHRPFGQEDTRLFSYTFKREIVPRGNNTYTVWRFRLSFTVL